MKANDVVKAHTLVLEVQQLRKLLESARYNDLRFGLQMQDHNATDWQLGHQPVPATKTEVVRTLDLLLADRIQELKAMGVEA